MPTILRGEGPDGRAVYARACWCCAEQNILTATSDPVDTPEQAERLPGKCVDCYLRSLAGLPVGRRLDS